MTKDKIKKLLSFSKLSLEVDSNQENKEEIAGNSTALRKQGFHRY